MVGVAGGGEIVLVVVVITAAADTAADTTCHTCEALCSAAAGKYLAHLICFDLS